MLSDYDSTKVELLFLRTQSTLTHLFKTNSLCLMRRLLLVESWRRLRCDHVIRKTHCFKWEWSLPHSGGVLRLPLSPPTSQGVGASPGNSHLTFRVSFHFQLKSMKTFASLTSHLASYFPSTSCSHQIRARPCIRNKRNEGTTPKT